MPNYVINEVVFDGLSPQSKAGMLQKLTNNAGSVDFGILLPPPLNSWPGNVGVLEKETFPYTHLDWCSKNWGTEWNAHEALLIDNPNHSLTLRFQTAWRPPYGWLVAVFNSCKLSFVYHYLIEGSDQGRTGKFDYLSLQEGQFDQKGWRESNCSEEMQKHLHLLLWGNQ